MKTNTIKQFVYPKKDPVLRCKQNLTKYVQSDGFHLYDAVKMTVNVFLSIMLQGTGKSWITYFLKMRHPDSSAIWTQSEQNADKKIPFFRHFSCP